jgi:GTPase SAR1 family protein
LGRMAEFQFESAVHLIEDEGPEEQIEEAKLIIRDTLSKATQQLSIISKEIDQTFELIKNELPADLKLFTTQLLKLMDRDNILNESVKLAKTRKKNIRKLWIGNFFKKLKNLIRGIVTFPWRYLKDIFKTYFLNAVTANPVKAPKSIQESVYKFLSETSDKISRLPYIYRKLFLFSPLTSARFYSAREKEVTALKDEYQNWINGKPGMVALVGELGSGKTTLLNMAKQNIFQADSWYHIDAISNVYNESEVNNLLAHKLDLNQTDSFDTLIQSIKKRKKRSVCILENLNFLFPKSVTGLELLESLMGFMVQTQDKIFWIITCSSYSWQYLKKTVRVEKYFHQVISLDAFSNGTIKSIIMNRHRLSGYDLLFESNGNHLHDRKLKKIKNEDHRQNYLKEQYFHFLNTISSGNISVAMLYWLRSIQSIEDDKVILNSAIDFDYDFLDSLTESELFTLASIINYEKLTVTDHATIFKQSVEQSRLNLNQMCRYGLLQEFDNYYHVHPFLYRHLVELLKSKNILH